MKVPMTPRSYRAMRSELQSLKAMRPELADAIEVARAHGDLSENADYDAAKEKSGMIEAKIRDLQARLANAQVIDPRKIGSINKVVFGCSVKVEDVDTGEGKTIMIVGADESSVEKNLISFESPLGRGLIGKEEGDIAEIKMPGGKKELEVLEIFIDYPEEEELASED